MRSLSARVERLERRAPPLREPVSSPDPITQWLCDRHPDLMQRYSELVHSFGPEEAIRRMSDDDLERILVAFDAALDALGQQAAAE